MLRQAVAMLSLWLAVPGLASAAPAAPAPVQVMIVGVFHMSNPGHDMHNLQVDDVLAARRQAQIAAIDKALSRFYPTLVAAEWDAPVVAERYPKYLAGTLAPSHNEVVQLGFRLAKANGARMAGIDADGDFLYEPLEAYAKAHGQTDLLAAMDGDTVRQVQTEARLLAGPGISAVLRYLNDPQRLKGENAFYRTALKIGDGARQPGVDLDTGWYRRNFLICAQLLQLAKPGDRVVVFFGSGHAFLLRQCVQETPGYQLVEPNAYLPR